MGGIVICNYCSAVYVSRTLTSRDGYFGFIIIIIFFFFCSRGDMKTTYGTRIIVVHTRVISRRLSSPGRFAVNVSSDGTNSAVVNETEHYPDHTPRTCMRPRRSRTE
jgi:hypothetical protein